MPACLCLMRCPSISIEARACRLTVQDSIDSRSIPLTWITLAGKQIAAITASSIKGGLLSESAAGRTLARVSSSRVFSVSNSKSKKSSLSSVNS